VLTDRCNRLLWRQLPQRSSTSKRKQLVQISAAGVRHPHQVKVSLKHHTYIHAVYLYIYIHIYIYIYIYIDVALGQQLQHLIFCRWWSRVSRQRSRHASSRQEDQEASFTHKMFWKERVWNLRSSLAASISFHQSCISCLPRFLLETCSFPIHVEDVFLFLRG